MKAKCGDENAVSSKDFVIQALLLFPTIGIRSVLLKIRQDYFQSLCEYSVVLEVALSSLSNTIVKYLFQSQMWTSEPLVPNPCPRKTIVRIVTLRNKPC